MSDIADEIWCSKNDGSKLIASLDDQEAKSSFDAKEEKIEDDMSQVSNDEEESVCVESGEESRSPSVDASEGTLLIRSEEVITSEEDEVWNPSKDLDTLKVSNYPFLIRRNGCSSCIGSKSYVTRFSLKSVRFLMRLNY